MAPIPTFTATLRSFASEMRQKAEVFQKIAADTIDRQPVMVSLSAAKLAHFDSVVATHAKGAAFRPLYATADASAARAADELGLSLPSLARKATASVVVTQNTAAETQDDDLPVERSSPLTR